MALSEGVLPSPHLQRRIREVQVFLEENLDRDVDLRTIAREASLSPYYFTRQFTAYVGVPPYRYLIGLRIERAKGRAVVLRKDGEQVGFDKLAISKDGRSVGWLALYPNCCTSYPIPLKLRVCSRGHVRTFEGDLPIWRWKFTGDGRQVSFEQETVHGGLGIHYELREVATGRLIAQYDPPPGTEGEPPPSQGAPPWVAELDANP